MGVIRYYRDRLEKQKRIMVVIFCRNGVERTDNEIVSVLDTPVYWVVNVWPLQLN